MSAAIDGFYLSKMTGAAGQGLVLFVMKGGVLVGADPFGVEIDGVYTIPENGGPITGKVTVKSPPGASLIVGVTADATGLTYETTFSLPPDFEARPFIRVDTPYGPLNINLKKLRGLGAT